jgi:hypothetical protein
LPSQQHQESQKKITSLALPKNFNFGGNVNNQNPLKFLQIKLAQTSFWLKYVYGKMYVVPN